MYRTQQAVRPRFIHAIIEDDLVLAAPADDSLAPAPAGPQQHYGKPAGSLLAGIRVNGKASLAEFRNSRSAERLAKHGDLDRAIAEIGRRATFTFAALLELPVLLAAHIK